MVRIAVRCPHGQSAPVLKGGTPQTHATLSLPQRGLLPLVLWAQPCLSRPLACDESPHHRHGSDWPWPPGYGTGAEDSPHHGHARVEKKGAPLRWVNQRLLHAFHPEHGEVVVRLAEAAEGDAQRKAMHSGRAWGSRTTRGGMPLITGRGPGWPPCLDAGRTRCA